MYKRQHPGWPNDTSTLYNVHKDLIKQKKIHGIEVVNGFEYYPKAFNYCKEYGLTYMGNTDIHGVYKQTYRTDKQSGPMTIVFAKERSQEGVKEALLAGRSVVKFGDILIGSEKNLLSLVKACLSYEDVYKRQVLHGAFCTVTPILITKNWAFIPGVTTRCVTVYT